MPYEKSSKASIPPAPVEPRAADEDAHGTNKSIFSLAFEEVKATQKLSGDGRPDTNLFIVGPRGAGKSTLLQRYLYPDKMEATKPTEAMEYTFARKTASPTGDRADVAHIWEVAGNPTLRTELCKIDNSDSLLLSMRNIATTVFLIVIDLSKPHDVLKIVHTWLDFIKQKTEQLHQKLSKRGSKLPEQLRARASKFFGNNHEDADSISHSGISVVIVANKYDTFRDHDAELKKVMSRALRYTAHTHGASLVYTAASPDTKSLSKEDRKGLDQFKALLNHLVFVGQEKKSSLKIQTEMDHLQPICVFAGNDRLKEIGRPKGIGSGGDGDSYNDWNYIFTKLFPPPKEESRTDGTEPDFSGYGETDVDLVKAQKDEELESYRAARAKEKQATMLHSLQNRRRSTGAR